jgi:hypothetical protein
MNPEHWEIREVNETSLIHCNTLAWWWLAVQEIREVDEFSPILSNACEERAAAQAVVDKQNRALQERRSRCWQVEVGDWILQEQGRPYERWKWTVALLLLSMMRRWRPMLALKGPNMLHHDAVARDARPHLQCTEMLLPVMQDPSSCASKFCWGKPYSCGWIDFYLASS